MLERFFETRAISAQTLFQTGDSFELGTKSKTVVNDDTVFQVNAVYSAVSLVASTISSLPLAAYIRDNGNRRVFRPQPQWVLRPDVDMTRESFYSALIVSLLLDGNAFIRVFRDSAGRPINLVILNPREVDVKRPFYGRMVFTLTETGEQLTSDDVVFIPDVVKPGQVRGVSRVEALKENFGLAIALERFASSFFGNGTTLSGIIEVPGNLTEEQADSLRRQFDQKHGGWRKSNRTGILSGGAKWTQTQTDPEKSTLIESRNQAVADVARAFNIPPHLLALPGTTSYASVEQSNLAWVTHCLRPIVTKIEGGLTPLLAAEPGGTTAFLRFNLDGLLRADIAARSTAYSTGIQAGYYTINDVRVLEDLPSVSDPAADMVRVPLANINVDGADLIGTQMRVGMARDMILAGFEPAATLAALNLPPVAHTGLPSTQLQPVAQIDPEDPSDVYEVDDAN